MMLSNDKSRQLLAGECGPHLSAPCSIYTVMNPYKSIVIGRFPCLHLKDKVCSHPGATKAGLYILDLIYRFR